LHGLSVGAVSGFAANELLNKAGISFLSLPILSNAIPTLAHKRLDALFIYLETGHFPAT